MHVRRLSWVGGAIFALALATPSIRAAEFEKYLPADTEVVFHANIRQALDSALARKYLLPQIQANLKGHAEVQEVLNALGLDPVKDLQSFTLAGPGNISEKNWTAFLRGSFDQDKIQAAADAFASTQAEVLKAHKQDGVTVYEIRDPKGARSAFAAFIEKDLLLIASTKDQVTASLAKKNAGKDSALNKSLSALIQEGDGKESMWFAVIPNQIVNVVPQNNKASNRIVDLLQNNKQAMDFAKKVKSLKAGVTLTDDVRFSLRIETSDAKAAHDVRQTLVGLQSLLILLVSNNDQLKDFGPILTDILNSIKFTLDKSTVGMDLSVSTKQIEEGLNK
jgi:hypothetical protein